MVTATNMTTMFKDWMGTLPFETGSFDELFKNGATLNEKFANVALTAMTKNAAITNKWTTDTLTKMGDINKAKADPADYAKAISDFASAQPEAAAENIAAYAEVAKKAQMDAAELFMKAGKEASEEAGAAVKKAANEMTAAAKKATSK